jgi:hypothetical protein
LTFVIPLKPSYPSLGARAKGRPRGHAMGEGRRNADQRRRRRLLASFSGVSSEKM